MSQIQRMLRTNQVNSTNYLPQKNIAQPLPYIGFTGGGLPVYSGVALDNWTSDDTTDNKFNDLIGTQKVHIGQTNNMTVSSHNNFLSWRYEVVLFSSVFDILKIDSCAVESHPTPGDIRGSSSPSRSISGISSHVADGGSARVPHECVQPSLSRSSSPSRSIHSPEHHVIFHPSCSHHVPKVA